MSMVFIIRQTGGDCTNGGASSRASMMRLYWPQEEIPATIQEDALRVVIRRLFGRVTIAHLEPVYADASSERAGHWHMFGGNYARGDSTFSERMAKLLGLDPLQVGPIPIHDRVEF